MAQRLGLIAGSGSFPVLFAQAATTRGYEVVCVAHRGETDPALENMVSHITWINLGQLGKLIQALKSGGVEEVVFAGGIAKQAMYRARPDLKAIMFLATLKDRSDDGVLRALAEELESKGMRVANPADYLAEVLARPGRIAGPALTAEQQKDVTFGMRLARQIGRLDVGQTVVVKSRAVVAVEAMEGTDRCIARAAELCGPGAVVAKACKPIQDLRFDLPTIGPRTIDTMAAAKAAVLAVEASKTIILDHDELVSRAEAGRVCVVAVEE
ncbi:MAG: UDP-2,3-diacylglucosamine diphosphatase LpxI [Pseudomonadota bacterium]